MFEDLINTIIELFHRLFHRLRKLIFTNQTKLSDLEATNLKLGLFHLRADNINDAIFRFKIVLLLNKNNAEAYYNLARCQYTKKQKHRAEKNLEKSLKISPHNKEALFLKSTLNKNTKITEVPISIIEDYYDNFAETYNEEFSIKQGYRAAQDLCMLANSYKKSADHLLDLGCGTGLAGFFLKDTYRKADLVGVDLSKNMLEVAHRSQEDSSNEYSSLVKSEFHSYLKKTKKKFDIITFCLSLHYKADFTKDLEMSSQILNKDGIIAFAIEKSSNDTSEQGLNAGYENFCFKKTSVKKQISNAGLKLLEMSESTIKNDRIALLCVCRK